jgi:signal transduction histidine kinase
VTFQRKLLSGVLLLLLPTVVIGLGALQSNVQERSALADLETRLGRSRTYAELETAMFDQVDVIWRFLSGMDPQARREFELTGQVVQYRLDTWRAELAPEESTLVQPVAALQRRFVAVGDSIFRLYDAGRRAQAYQLAQVELRSTLQPALTALNREIYRRTRESSVQGAFQRVQQIVLTEQRTLLLVFVGTVLAGVLVAWVLSRSLARPINELRAAMDIVGAGNLDYPIASTSRDEIGDLARAFAAMTRSLRESRGELVRLNDELGAKIRQLQQAQTRLIQSEKLASIGEMAAAVAHGLRNPLASLRASAQFVLRHPGATAAGEQLQAIVSEVDRLDRRISHLLTFSRPDPFHPSPEQAGQLLQAVLPAFADRVRSQGVELSLAVPDSLPPLTADAMRMEQTLTELIANALDAMPGGGRLTLGAAEANAADGRPGIELAVTDTGKGIPPAVLDEVGQLFFTTRPEGTGLGLATARRFVEQHDGRLDLTSREGVGTTVRVWLPLAGPGSATPAGGAA